MMQSNCQVILFNANESLTEKQICESLEKYVPINSIASMNRLDAPKNSLKSSNKYYHYLLRMKEPSNGLNLFIL